MEFDKPAAGTLSIRTNIVDDSLIVSVELPPREDSLNAGRMEPFRSPRAAGRVEIPVGLAARAIFANGATVAPVAREVLADAKGSRGGNDALCAAAASAFEAQRPALVRNSSSDRIKRSTSSCVV